MERSYLSSLSFHTPFPNAHRMTGSLYFFDVVTILSNAILIMPVVLSFFFRLYVQTVVWIVVFVASMLYHLCLQELEACVAPLELLEAVDVSFAMTGFFVCILMLLAFVVEFDLLRDVTIVFVFHLFVVATTIATGTLFSIPGLVAMGGSMVGFGVLLVLAFLHKNRRLKGTKRMRRAFRERVDIPMYVAAVVLGLLGMACFQLHMLIGEDYYPITHSLWHIFLMLGVSLGVVAIRGHALGRNESGEGLY